VTHTVCLWLTRSDRTAAVGLASPLRMWAHRTAVLAGHFTKLHAGGRSCAFAKAMRSATAPALSNATMPAVIDHPRPCRAAVRARAMATATDAPTRLGKLQAEGTALLICDVQERFRTVIHNFPAVVDTSKRMVRARPPARGTAAQGMNGQPSTCLHALRSAPPRPGPPAAALASGGASGRGRPTCSGLVVRAPPPPCMQLRTASALSLPVVVSEQYPERLGSTVEELQAFIPTGSPGARTARELGVGMGLVCVCGGGVLGP
jgi:hypothetical protein